MAALNAYLADEGTDMTVEAIENLTVAELISACKSINGITCAQMLNALGITLDEKVEGMLSIHNSYEEFINICAKVLTRLNVTGNGANLAGNKVAGTYATYTFDTEIVNRISVDVKITTVATTGKVTISKPTLNLPIGGGSGSGSGGTSVPAIGGAEKVKGYKNYDLPDGMNAMLIDAGIDGLTVEGFMILFNVETDGAISYVLKIRNHFGEEVTGDQLIGTGFTFTIMAYDGVNYHSETHKLVIAGDTNGDGKITVNDAVLITGYFHNNGSLSDAEKIAADLNGNDEIDISDAVKLSYKYTNFDKYNSAFAQGNN